MNRFVSICIFAVLSFLAYTVAKCEAQVLNAQGNLTEAAKKLGEDLSWAKKPWTGNNAPFAKARKQLDTEFQQARTYDGEPAVMRLLEKYRAVAQQNFKSPLAQFRWAYAAYKTINPTMNGHKIRRKVVWGVVAGLASVPDPRAYDYDRVRFFIHVADHRAYELQELGKRLLSERPEDDEVHLRYTGLLIWSKNPQARDEALRRANILLQKYKANPRYWSLLAMTHLARWEYDKNPKEAEATIRAYEHYLKIAPQDYHLRGYAEHIIKALKQQLKELTNNTTR